MDGGEMVDRGLHRRHAPNVDFPIAFDGRDFLRALSQRFSEVCDLSVHRLAGFLRAAKYGHRADGHHISRRRLFLQQLVERGLWVRDDKALCGPSCLAFLT